MDSSVGDNDGLTDGFGVGAVLGRGDGLVVGGAVGREESDRVGNATAQKWLGSRMVDSKVNSLGVV